MQNKEDIFSQIKFDILRAGEEFLEAEEKDRFSFWETDRLYTFEEFVENELGIKTLSERQKLVGAWFCGDDPFRIFENGNDLCILVWGKGSGKDFMACLISLYFIYVLLNLRDPSKYFDLAPNSEISCLNVAASARQANEVFFSNFITRLLSWKTLRQKYNIIESGKKLNPEVKGEDSILITRSIHTASVIFPKNIKFFSGHSAQETLEGKNLLVYIMDEASAFSDKNKIRNAWKVYRMLRSSAFSRFGARKFSSKGFLLSYPRYQDDFILKMYKWGRNKLHVYTDLAATWEVLPKSFFKGEYFTFKGLNIPVEFAQAFEEDPVDALRKYACQPPEVEEPFIKPELYDVEQIKYIEPIRILETEDYIENGMLRKRVLKTLDKIPTKDYILTFDLGRDFCKAVLTVLHKENDKIFVDYITYWDPQKYKKSDENSQDDNFRVKVDFENVEKILFKIVEMVNIVGVFADRWNSAFFLDKAKNLGKITEEVNLTDADYTTYFRIPLFSGKLMVPREEKLLEEFKTIELVKGKVEGRKDIIDTITLGCKVLENGEKFLKEKNRKIKFGVIVKGEMRLPGTFVSYGEYENKAAPIFFPAPLGASVLTQEEETGENLLQQIESSLKH
jgi:hypothetical protein